MNVCVSPSAVAPHEPLDAGRIRAALPSSGVRLGGLAVHGAIDSTNAWLQERSATLPSPYACLSEHQLAGRGRRGRTWVDAMGRDICLSLLWRFALAGARSQGLSLAIGVAAVRALAAVGAQSVKLKWPNDIVWQNRKLGGILIEGSVSGRVWTAVIGIGINVREETAPELGLPRVHLESIVDAHVSRNRVAAFLIAELLAECARFEERGAGPAIGEWGALDAMKGHPVRVEAACRKIDGVARGVDESGELLVEVDGTIERFVSAEVSLRAGAVKNCEDVA